MVLESSFPLLSGPIPDPVASFCGTITDPRENQARTTSMARLDL